MKRRITAIFRKNEPSDSEFLDYRYSQTEDFGAINASEVEPNNC